MNPIADARYWFRNSRPSAYRRGPVLPFGPQGALIFEDGSVLVLDYSKPEDEKKLSGLKADEVVGQAWRDRKTGHWRAEVKSLVRAQAIGEDRELAEAVKKALSERDLLVLEEVSIQGDPPALLDRELALHDWWAMMSDSYAVTLAGERHMKDIMGIISKMDPQTVRPIWAKHAPKEFACPV